MTWRDGATGPRKRVRNAIERPEFVPAYQPKMNLEQCDPAGPDRWRHPERGLVPTAPFHTVAERCFIVPTAVGLASLPQAKAWQDAGLRTMRIRSRLRGGIARQGFRDS